ncbi:RNA-binding protein 44 [Mantella aurantiaca]
MDHPESLDYTVVRAKEAASVHCGEDLRGMVHCKENLCSNCVQQQESSSSKISNCQCSTDSSMILEHQAITIESESDKEKNEHKEKNQSTVGTVAAFGKDIVNFLQVEPHDISAGLIISGNRVTAPDHLCSCVQPNKISHKCKETIPGIWGKLDSMKLAQVVPEKDGQYVYQWQKHLLDKFEKPIDQEYSIGDLCDDDTFFSIKSGSYSRSSSPLSLDDHTDAESCFFEEALEDLSSNYLYNQKKHLQGNLRTFNDPDQQSVAVSLKMSNGVEVTAKQYRNISCNAALSTLNDYRSDKETQTKVIESLEMGVNTDVDFAGISSQDAVNLGSECCKNMDCKGNKYYSSTSHEALMERAVNAELKLLDVQRWMCWQLCWKSQQQYMEKQSLINMHTAFAGHSQAAVCFNPLSALAEVEEKYLKIKTQIQSGVPLDALVPLSMQLTEVKTPPDNLLNWYVTEFCQLEIQKWSADRPEEMQKHKQTCASPCTPTATKDLQKEGREDHRPAQLYTEKKTSYVHVGNIPPSVKEEDLRTAFEKFDVSNLFLEESSLTSSYAVLIFTCSEKAQTAVTEMDGKMFFGRKIKVCIVKNAVQNFQFHSQEIKIVSATLPEERTNLGIGGPQERLKLGIGEPQERSKLGIGEPPERSKLGIGEPPERSKLGIGEPPERSKLGTGEPPERSKLGTGEPQERSKLGIGGPQERSKLGIGGPQERSKLGIGGPQERSKLGIGGPQERSKLGIGEPQARSKLGIGGPQERSKLGIGEPQERSKLGIGEPQARSKLGIGEPQERSKLGIGEPQERSKLGIGEPQETSKLGIGEPQEKTKLGIGEPQSFIFQPNVSTFSKPIQNSIKKGSHRENLNASSNMRYSIASFSSASQTVPSAPTSSTATILGYMPPASQWAWHTVPGAFPFSFQTPVNPPVCIPSIHLNSNVQFHFDKDVGFGVPPTGKYPVYSHTIQEHSTGTFNRDTSAVTTIDGDSAVQPAKNPLSAITKSSENKHGSSGMASTTETSAVSSTLQISAKADCKMPALSDSLPPNEIKTKDTSEKSSFKPAAPLRFPVFVPDSVTIPETSKTCHSTITTNSNDLLSQPSNTKHQQNGCLPLDEMEWGVYPKLDRTEFPVFIVPNRLNLSQFARVMDYLLERHKNVTRDDVVSVLEEIRISRGGFLSSLTIPQILRQASSKLAAKNMPPA